MLATYRRLIALRRANAALRSGTLRLLDVADPDVLVFARELDDRAVVVVVAFAAAARHTTVPELAEGTWRALGGTHRDPPMPAAGGILALRPLEAVILERA